MDHLRHHLRTMPFALLISVCLADILSAQSVPLPIVARSTRPPSAVFAKPGLIVYAKIREVRIVEDRDVDGESWIPPKLHQEFRLDLAAVVRVNERLGSQPDLADADFILRVDPGDRLELGFGKIYLLMVDFAPVLPGISWSKKHGPPHYTIGVKDVGFEDDGRRVHVLRLGGELSIYDGKLTSELLESIRRVRP